MEGMNEAQAREMFEDMEYNDKMVEYKFLYEKHKKRFMEFFCINLFWTAFAVFFEVFSSWDKESKLLGPVPCVIVFAVFAALSAAALTKKLPELFLICAAEMIGAAIFSGAWMYIFIAVFEVFCFFMTREMNDVKKLPGYPAFALRKVRHKM